MLRNALKMTLVIGSFAVACVSGEDTSSLDDDDNGSGGSGARASGGTGAKPGTGGGTSGGSGPNGNGGSNPGSGGGDGTGGSSQSTGGSNPGTGGSNPGTGGSSSGGTGGTTNGEACGWTPGYSGPPLGRCDANWCKEAECAAPGAGTAVSKGGFLTLDDFEGASKVVTNASSNIGINWPSRDNRTGGWALYAHAAGQGKIETASAGGGGSAQSTKALHFTGVGSTESDFYATTTGLPISNCYDASAYDGLSVWIKGNPSAGNSQIKLNLHTPPTEPVEAWNGKRGSGVCKSGCYDHYSVLLDITPGWTRHKLPWSAFKRQNCTPTDPPVPDNFEPQKMLLQISFSQVDPTKGFDVWIDDMTFDIESSPKDNFGQIVTKPIFNELFKTPMAGMTHENLVQAVNTYGSKWGNFAADGTSLDRKHEAAAWLAQVAHETGSLRFVVEQCQEAVGEGPPCTSGAKYYGRGVIQLTHDYNYTAAQNAGFSGIVDQPQKVADDPLYAFGVGIYFWMTTQSAKGICHSAIMGQDFGQTTNIINGDECTNPARAGDQKSRGDLYKAFAAALGINARGRIYCQ